MFIMKRNQVIITALVIMIAVAGYLNYVDSRGLATASTISTDGLVLNENGEINALVPDEDVDTTQLTNTEVAESDIGIALTSPTEEQQQAVEATTNDTESLEPGTAIFVNSSVNANLDDTYFIQAKLVREQDRSKQKEILTEMINNKNLEQAQRAEFATQMLDIQKRIEKESSAEAMIEAKGFKEVYVRIDDKTVDVVVNKETLTDAEIAQIEDIVKRKTGIETENIRISPMKKQ